jgi:hypothetical protein
MILQKCWQIVFPFFFHDRIKLFSDVFKVSELGSSINFLFKPLVDYAYFLLYFFFRFSHEEKRFLYEKH